VGLPRKMRHFCCSQDGILQQLSSPAHLGARGSSPTGHRPQLTWEEKRLLITMPQAAAPPTRLFFPFTSAVPLRVLIVHKGSHLILILQEFTVIAAVPRDPREILALLLEPLHFSRAPDRSGSKQTRWMHSAAKRNTLTPISEAGEMEQKKRYRPGLLQKVLLTKV